MSGAAGARAIAILRSAEVMAGAHGRSDLTALAGVERQSTHPVPLRNHSRRLSGGAFRGGPRRERCLRRRPALSLDQMHDGVDQREVRERLGEVAEVTTGGGIDLLTAPKTLGESSRGRHSHSTLPLAATSAVTSQSERNAYSAMGGKGEVHQIRIGAIVWLAGNGAGNGAFRVA